MSDWASVTLAEVCSRPQYGAIAKGTTQPVGPRFVRQTDIVSGRIDWTSVPFCDLDESDFDRYAIETGDLLISRLGAGVGAAAIVHGAHEAVFAGYLVRFQADQSRAVPEFLGYQLRSLGWRNHVNGFRSGAAQPTLNAQQMAAFRFDLPSIEEQRGIAAALAALDDKIESNDRAISLQEQLGSALLASRLQIGPSGALVADKRLLSAFIKTLETGSRPRGGLKEGTVGTVSLGAQHVQSAGVCKTAELKQIPTDFVDSMRRGRLEDGDVLVYKDGGKPGNFIPHVSAFGYGFPVDTAVINEHVYRVRATRYISQALLYWALRSPWLDEEMRKRGTGVAIPGLNSSNFRELPFPALEEDSRVFLNDMLSPMFEKILRLGAENVRLGAQREALLPALLSGRIRVPEAVYSIEGVLA